MLVKVLNVEQVKFRDGNTSNRVFCLTEDKKVGNFFTSIDVVENDMFELSIGVDSNCKFCVRKEKVVK